MSTIKHVITYHIFMTQDLVSNTLTPWLVTSEKPGGLSPRETERICVYIGTLKRWIQWDVENQYGPWTHTRVLPWSRYGRRGVRTAFLPPESRRPQPRERQSQEGYSMINLQVWLRRVHGSFVCCCERCLDRVQASRRAHIPGSFPRLQNAIKFLDQSEANHGTRTWPSGNVNELSMYYGEFESVAIRATVEGDCYGRLFGALDGWMTHG